jgi:hypothetical protein
MAYAFDIEDQTSLTNSRQTITSMVEIDPRVKRSSSNVTHSTSISNNDSSGRKSQKNSTVNVVHVNPEDIPSSLVGNKTIKYPTRITSDNTTDLDSANVPAKRTSRVSVIKVPRSKSSTSSRSVIKTSAKSDVITNLNNIETVASSTNLQRNRSSSVTVSKIKRSIHPSINRTSNTSDNVLM